MKSAACRAGKPMEGEGDEPLSDMQNDSPLDYDGANLCGLSTDAVLSAGQTLREDEEAMKLFVRIGDCEFKAEGSAEVISALFELFLKYSARSYVITGDGSKEHPEIASSK